MKENSKINCGNIPQHRPLSYYVRITVPKPKIRIWVPKLLSNTMRKRFGYVRNVDRVDVDVKQKQPHNKKEKMTNKRGRMLRNKIASIFTNAIVNMKIKSPPDEKSYSNIGRNFIKSKTKFSRNRAKDDATVCARPFFTFPAVGEERGGEELCKKRILMGGKCKPLSLSGTLHYDDDGILLPEILP